MDVEGDAIVDAECRLNLGRGRGKGLVGGRGGEHDQADLGSVDAGVDERTAARLGGEGGGGLPVGGNIAAADPGPLDDPFVRGVDLLGKFSVGNATLRQG